MNRELAADLGLHAGRQALETIFRIAELAHDDTTRIAILINAFAILESRRRIVCAELNLSSAAEQHYEDTIRRLTKVTNNAPRS